MALLAFAVGCDRTPEIETVSARIRSHELRPTVLITLDTTRRDHLGCYGYFRNTTPSIDAFAAESVRFDRAVTTAPNTLPSHMSMMTGLYAHQHAVPDNLPRGRPALDAQPATTWVPSILASAKYETAAFVSALVLGPETGMSQGFDVFDVIMGKPRKGTDTTDVALRWLAERTDRPFFLWIHLYDAHEPNQPPEPYARMFASDARLDAEIDARGIHPERIAASESKGGLCRVLFPDLLPRLAENADIELPPVDRASIRDLMNRYDADVRYTDDCVGRIIAALKERGVFERAIVAIVGDHGQSLGQNDWLTHGRITNENLLVPMLVHFPREMLSQPTVLAGTVSTIDLFPTILGAFEDKSLQGFVKASEGSDVFEVGARTFALAQGALIPSGDGPMGAVVLLGDRWRYEDPRKAAPRLFDLTADPLAEHDVSASHVEVCAQFKSALTELLARRAKEPRRPSKPSREHRQALKDLGYAGDD